MKGPINAPSIFSDTSGFYPVYTIRFHIENKLENKIAYCLAETFVHIALSSSATRKDRKYNNSWILEWIMDAKPDVEELITRLSLQVAAHNIQNIDISAKHIEIEKTPDINWLEKTYQEFKPFSIGPFFIYGSHYEGEIPKEQIELQVNAATAFGSGEHETTKGCMQAMLDLKGKGACPWNILDMGTGSGILAIAAWKLWKSPILAVDNDPESIRVTERHAEMNGVSLSKMALTCDCGDGFNTPSVDKQKPYELILANILAAPVIEMAPDLVRVLDDNGYCVLSGMLVEQAHLVASAYEGEGLTLKKQYDIGEWSTLVLQK
ncbi:MAG: 50S ribosomal protein L11 methyltransferase [Zetaproteobacteria bacterium]|nr:MAG: 50S ribosomal protein L11 methyltransferase [Zetaproteobacteria bacterium]